MMYIYIYYIYSGFQALCFIGTFQQLFMLSHTDVKIQYMYASM